MGFMVSCELILLNSEIIICTLKAIPLSRIFCCKPMPVAMAIIITTMSIAIAAIPIFIIGAETLLLYALLSMMRFAIKYSKFKRIMVFLFFKNTVLFFVLTMLSCGNVSNSDAKRSAPEKSVADTAKTRLPVVGANQTENYLTLLKGRRVGIVANQTSVIFKSDHTFTHLVDSLLALQIDIKKVFAPEHGFRGNADAGELIKDGTDIKTGLPLISLYGNNKKPTHSQLEDIDILV